MTRYAFFGDVASFTFGVSTDSPPVMLVGAGAVIPLFTDAALSQPAVGLQLPNGTPVTGSSVTASASGLIPTRLGPDDVTVMYASNASGEVVAFPSWSLAAALLSRVAALESTPGTVHVTMPNVDDMGAFGRQLGALTTLTQFWSTVGADPANGSGGSTYVLPANLAAWNAAGAAPPATHSQSIDTITGLGATGKQVAQAATTAAVWTVIGHDPTAPATLQLGTTSTTALAGDTVFDLSTITGASDALAAKVDTGSGPLKLYRVTTAGGALPTGSTIPDGSICIRPNA